MIYRIDGIWPTDMLQAIQAKKTPRVMVGGFDDLRIKLDVEATDIIKRDSMKVRVAAAKVLMDNGFEASPDQIPPYQEDRPINVYLIKENAEDRTSDPASYIEVFELHNYGAGAVERIAEDLKTAGLDVSWEFDEETNKQIQGWMTEQNGEKPWQIEGHTYYCTCLPCSLIRASTEMKGEKSRQEQFGWVGHLVSGDPNVVTGFNAHTHGDAKYNHPDFQIIIPIPDGLINHIFHVLWNQIREGKKFKAGDVVKEAWKGGTRSYDVALIDAVEGGRPVLRVIIPDEHGHLAKEDLKDAHPDFLLQYEV